MTYLAAPDRYDDRMPYRRTGRWGIRLPAVSLGLWHNFGDDKPLETQRAILRRAFDLGVTHFDLANNYGPVNGAAERLEEAKRVLLRTESEAEAAEEAADEARDAAADAARKAEVLAAQLREAGG